MIGKRRREQLLADAAFNDLSPKDQDAFTKRVAREPAMADEADDLRQFLDALPSDPPLFEGNLLPAVRAQIAAESARTPSPFALRGRLTGYAVAAACVLGVFGAVLMQPGNGQDPGHASVAALEEPAQSAVQTILAEAAQMRSNGNATGAYSLLTEAMAAHPEDRYAAEAQLALASIAFEDLQWYREAEEGYDAFARDYTTSYLMHPEAPEIAFRRNLLAEARASGYEPLYALADAGTALGELESILARHPAGFVAVQAVEQMVAAIPNVTSDVEALELVRQRCTDPIALAHLDVELADRYANDLGDGIRARALLEDVASRQDSHYASMAAEKLLLLSSD